MHSGSSLSLASQALSSQHWHRRTRELPPLSRVSQEKPPPLPPLPATSHTSPRDRLSPISPVSVPSCHTTSPTSSIHSRSLPVPPTPLSTKPPMPPFLIMPSYSSPASPDLGPAASSFTESQRDYNSPIKLPPNYSASTQAPARGAVERGGVGRSLSIRTTNISHGSGALSARSASIRVAPSRSGLASGDGDPFDLPPAYTAIDITPSPLLLGGVNGDSGIDEE
ncbi:hypothetical protein BJY52DRAFT_1281121 [Lactarius psammicola]|nr:hypothetical protein BJY52DRAFT_1281121 [Lactarius psammicola]